MTKYSFTMYDFVYNDLVKKIKSGVLKPGDKLPSVANLCDIYETSDATIRKSISMLKNAGLIVAVNRVGYYVSEEVYAKKQIFSFDENTCVKNIPDSYDLISVEKVNNKKYGKVLMIKRLYKAHNLPSFFKINMMPYRAKVKNENYDVVIKEMDMILDSHFLKKTIEFSSSDDLDIKKRLYLLDNMMLFCVKRVYTTEDGNFSGITQVFIPGGDINVSMAQNSMEYL